MKRAKYLFLISMVTLISSCSPIKVMSDYDTKVDFNQYKTFAFYKKGIDKATISDLDKKRILRAIETELLAKGYTKSEKPDFLVSIFTKSREKVNVTSFNNAWGYGYGWGWNPWMWGPSNRVNVNRYTEGTLFVDIIDKAKNELVWQGIGSGALNIQNREKKEERIKEFVAKILSKYPPGLDE